MSVKFNPLTGNFDLVDPMSIGSTVIGGAANQVLYVDSSTNLAQNAGFEFYDAVAGAGEEYLFGLTNTFSLGVQGEGSGLFNSYNSLTLNDTRTFNNDGTNEYVNARSTQKISGTVNQNGAIAGMNHYGNSVTLYNPAPYILNGDSDLSVGFYGYYANVNGNSLSVPTSGDTPTIILTGAYLYVGAAITSGVIGGGIGVSGFWD